MKKSNKNTKLKYQELKAERKAQRKLRWQQLRMTFNLQRKEDKYFLPLIVGSFLAICIIVGFIIHILTNGWWGGISLGIIIGVIVSLVIFSKRIQKTMYKKAANNLGAGGWVLENMRGSWRVNTSITGNSHLDILHLVVGKPGIILVGEGSSHRLKNMFSQEKKRISKIVGDVPIYDITVGETDTAIPLPKLEKTIKKLPKNIKNNEIDILNNRITTLTRRGMPLPKGPIPQQAKIRSVQRITKRNK